MIAQILSTYIDSMTSLSIAAPNHIILSAMEMDQMISRFSNISLDISTSTSLLMVQSPNSVNRNTTILGGVFNRKKSGQIMDGDSRNRLLNSNVSVAAFFSNSALIDVKSINILIIDKLSYYETLDQTDGQRLVSSIVIANLQRNNTNNTKASISLMFQILNEYNNLFTGGSYRCSFYNHKNLKWDDTVCSLPFYNAANDRYECTCDHLSTFALIWSPRVCRNLSETQGLNGTCILKTMAQVIDEFGSYFNCIRPSSNDCSRQKRLVSSEIQPMQQS